MRDAKELTELYAKALEEGGHEPKEDTATLCAMLINDANPAIVDAALTLISQGVMQGEAYEDIINVLSLAAQSIQQKDSTSSESEPVTPPRKLTRDERRALFNEKMRQAQLKRAAMPRPKGCGCGKK